MINRRELIAGTAAARFAALATASLAAPIVDSHVHLFDPKRFPYHPNATYQPAAETLEDYSKFAVAAGIDHAVIVHPEPYQDDHSYLEYCFAHEPSKNFFKGTCLFDPTAPDTPARMRAFVKKNPGRIVALRVHEVGERGTPPASSGAIKNRDLRSPAMAATWRAAQELGIAIQMHFAPHYAPRIGELAARFEQVPVILDHLGRAGQGTPEDFDGVLQLARQKQVIMKFSGVNYSSKQPFPHADAKPMIRRIYDAFGPQRIIWGTLGMNRAAFDQQSKLLDSMFDFAPVSARAAIRGANALRLFHWA